MFENPRRGRQARNFTTNVLKILDLKSSSEQIFSENWRWVPLCDRSPNKSATQHASGTNVNKPAQNLKKKYQKLYWFKRTDQYSGQEISLNIAWVKSSKQAKRRECLPSERLVQDKKYARNKALLAGNLIPLVRNSERREDEEIGLLH